MSKSRITFRAAGLTASVAIFSSGLPALAQSSAAAPTREEIQRGIIEQALKGQAQALPFDGEVERSACPLAGPEFSDVRFTLKAVDFTGLISVDPESLSSAYADYVGQDVPVAVVCDIRDRAATILRSKGYLAAVQVPPQTIDQGNVRFDVLMARMTAVQVRGDAGPSESLLQKYIEKLAAQPVFNINTADRYLLLARDIPGLDVRLSLRPVSAESGGRPGEVVGEFNVFRTPVYADVNFQNFGSEAVGRFGGLARIRFNGLTGMGDETVISSYSTSDFEEQQVLQVGHQFTMGGEGLKFGGDFTYAWTKPELPGGFSIKSETLVASAYASYPFLRKQTRNIFGTIGLDYINQRTDILRTRTNEDRLSVAYARLDFNQIESGSISGRGGYSAFEPKWGVGGSLELRQGLDILGASEGCGAAFVNCIGQTVIPTRADGEPTAFVVRGQAKIDYRPTPLLAFTLKPRFQYSPDALFSYEEISGGNYTTGRGYDPGTIIGDSGYGLQTEVSYGSLLPDSPEGIAIQPYLFFDLMGVWNRNIPGDPQKLYSAGGGFRATIGQQASLDMTTVVPLKRAAFQTRRDSARALLTLTIQLAPWRRR
ncbi:ShlB/FhaC/HecB family hemolysin secretion/activation protein [Sphingorhabdus sp. M41]|uniref:ShlB/FhaC/HecB family hemolysin secretion/activation protein n=1 Tax=Sphingorhabdus sp. M41 TaxID=1806885 RepID=UPI00078B3715|nr:ShlB/FhaC/HecB family hemolysin secretion/activation protein [Sphingorhabdus sp. M41]AMO72314.1 hemin transporter [Sphingorhabdus sp. M41]